MTRDECLDIMHRAQEALSDAIAAIEENDPQAVLEALTDVAYGANQAIIGIAISVLNKV